MLFYRHSAEDMQVAMIHALACTAGICFRFGLCYTLRLALPAWQRDPPAPCPLAFTLRLCRTSDAAARERLGALPVFVMALQVGPWRAKAHGDLHLRPNGRGKPWCPGRGSEASGAACDLRQSSPRPASPPWPAPCAVRAVCDARALGLWRHLRGPPGVHHPLRGVHAPGGRPP